MTVAPCAPYAYPMSYCVMRVAKIKSRVSLLRCIKHNNRDIIPPNANPEASKSNSLGKRTTAEAMKIYTEKLSNQKVRKNAVHALEFVLTASNDSFSESKDDQELAETWGEYLGMCGTWVAEKFGKDNILKSTIHWDELTPHIHVVLVPMVEGKLNARAMIGGSSNRLRELQDEFFEEVGSKYGLERGLPREQTKARHKEVKEYYKIVDKVVLEQRQRDARRMAEAQAMQAKYRSSNDRGM